VPVRQRRFRKAGEFARLPRRDRVTFIRNAFVYSADADNNIYPQGAILVHGDRIVAVGPVAEVERQVAALGSGSVLPEDGEQTTGSVRVIDAGGKMAFPGLVNAHWHEAFVFRAVTGTLLAPDDRNDDPGPFANGGDFGALSVQFDGQYDFGRLLTDDEAYVVALYSLWTQLRAGTTCYADIGSANKPEAIARATLDLGIRGRVGLWACDGVCAPGESGFRRTRDSDDVLAAIETVVQRWGSHPSGRLRAIPSVISVPNASDELCVGLKAIADRFSTPYGTHLAALRSEQPFVEERFGKRSIARFEDLGLLTDRLIGVHTAFITDDERRRLMAARVAINHAPGKYGAYGETTISETEQIAAFIRDDGLVSLSTDGDGNPIGAMPEAMKLAWLGHNEAVGDLTRVPPSRALAMATRHAAEALVWADRIGSLEPGKKADLVLVPIDDWRYEGVNRPLQQFLALGSSGDIDTVMVDGRLLVENGRATGVDEQALTSAYRAAVASATARNFPQSQVPQVAGRSGD
jgi:cytosine/adenosine deaminase-related metal-dependent hydrolase